MNVPTPGILNTASNLTTAITVNEEPEPQISGELPTYAEAIGSPPTYTSRLGIRPESASLSNEMAATVHERTNRDSRRQLASFYLQSVTQDAPMINGRGGMRHSIAVPYTIPLRPSRERALIQHSIAASPPTRYPRHSGNRQLRHPGTLQPGISNIPNPSLSQQVGHGVVMLTLQTTSVVCLVLGAIFFNHCPIEPRIPLYMLLMGLFIFGTTILWFCSYLQQLDCRWLPCRALSNQCTKVLTTGLFLLSVTVDVSWLIAGTYWVLGVFKNVSFSPKAMQNYCHETLYASCFLFNVIAIILLCVLTCTLLMTNATKLT